MELSADMEAARGIREAGGDTIVTKVEATLDADVWGRLQDHIPLDTVYEKLPYRDLFRLRVVCKAWNSSALRRLESKPYFVTIAAGNLRALGGLYLSGLVKYDADSGKGRFKRQSVSLHRMHEYTCLRPFEVEGLIFCHNPRPLSPCGVYSIHTKTWHVVSVVPECWDPDSVCGMMVDTSERPYTFKLVLGCTAKKTQVYDSRARSWTTASSMLVHSHQEPNDYEVSSFSCMNHDGCVYMSLGQEMVLVYTMKEDSWTALDFPPMVKVGDHNTLGVWDGRIFTARGDLDELNVSVRELVDPTNQLWDEYARCSEDEFHRLMFFDDEMQVQMGLVSVFCDEYLFLYNWHYKLNRAIAFVMFNLKTKKWEPVELPIEKVSIEYMILYEFEDGEMGSEYEDDVDEEDNLDEVDEDDVDDVDYDEHV